MDLYHCYFFISRDLAEKHHVLLRKFDRKTKAMKRLSMNNEELTWRLSQTEAGSTPDIFRMLSNTQLSTQSNTSSPTTRTRDSVEPRQRPKSMVLLSPVHSPSSGEKPPLQRSSGIKLRRPRMFESTDNGNLANTKVGSSLRQSDVWVLLECLLVIVSWVNVCKRLFTSGWSLTNVLSRLTFV